MYAYATLLERSAAAAATAAAAAVVQIVVLVEGRGGSRSVNMIFLTQVGFIGH